MRLASVARRSVAVLAAAALVSTGGLVTGAFVGTAGAQEAFSVFPPTPFNTGTQLFTLTSGSFGPSSIQEVALHRVIAADGQGDIAGTIADNTLDCIPAPSGLDCGTTMTFEADLANVAPGAYDVVLTNTATSEVDTCASCVGIASSGNPTLVSTARYNATDGQLVLTGTNLSKGTRVEFLQTDSSGTPTVVDPNMSFVATTTSGTTTTSGYVNSTTLRGTYTAGAGAVPGLHKLRVTDTDGQRSNLTSFYQPQLASASPAALGQGATAVPTTITGTGFNPSSTYSISSVATTADITVLGPAVVTATTVLANVSVTATSAAQARTVTVRGAEGGFASSGTIFSVNVGPKFASSSPVTPNTRGQGSSSPITISGTGFNAGTVFNFGADTTATTTGVNPGGTSATVTVAVADVAAAGARNVIATNSDFGSATLASGFTVKAAPRIVTVTPASGSAGSAPFNVILDGSGFATSGGVTLAMVPSAGITIGTVNVISPTQLQTTFTIASNAAAGARDVIVTNVADGGTSTCTSCFSVNSLSVTPATSGNDVIKNLTLASAQAGAPLSASTTVRVFLPGFPAYQPVINGTNVVYDSGTGKVTTDVDLRGVATGTYSVESTTGTSVLICTACLTVASPSNPSVTAISPALGGQGATGRLVTLTGTNFSPGETVTFSGTGVTASNVQYVSSTQLTAVVAITSTALVGQRNVTVTNIGDKKSGVLTNGFTVTVAPVTASIDPTAIGQGGVVDVTLTGTGYAAGAVADFGAGTTNVLKDASGIPTTMVFTVTDSPTADTTALRAVTVTNTDGGTATLADALTITAAPVITAISPNVGKADQTLTDVTITGTGFVAETAGEGAEAVTTLPQVIIGGVTVTVKSVSADGTTMVADFVVKSAALAGTGPRDARVINPDKGESTKVGAFTVAQAPVAPTSVAVTTGSNAATVTWDFPTAEGSDGYSPLTGFVVDDGDAATANSVTVGPAVRTADLSGLTNGLTYTFTVKAMNAVGTGAAGTATGTPVGVPLAPTTVNAVGGDSKARVTFSGANAQGAPITHYTVKASNGTEVEVVAPQSFADVTGLTNGTAYTFTVKAKNSAGYGAFSTAFGSATPKIATKLTSTRSPATGTAGSAVTYSGKLTRLNGGAAIAGARIVVKLTPDIGASRNVAATTNISGVWSFRFAPTYNTTVRASFAGNTNEGAVNAPAYKMGVAPRISRSAPASGATSPASTNLAVKGSISPNKVGRTIGLYNGTRLIGKATVASNGTFTINVKLARGTYTLRIGIGATAGNVAGNSANFIVRRT